MRALGGLVAIVLVFLPAQASAQTFLPSDEERVHHMVDATRAEHGLGPLTRSGALDRVARAQSSRMVDRQELFHNPNLAAELTDVGVEWLWSGENVGVGPYVVAIHDAFVASLHHYENIVRSNYDHIGVGVVSNPAGGVYVTHVFAQLEEASAPPARSTVPLLSPPSPPSPSAAPPPLPPIAAPTPTPTAAPPAPIAVEGGIVAPGPPIQIDEPPDSGVFASLGRLFRWVSGRS